VAASLPEVFTDGGINNVVPAGSGWLFLSTWATGDPDIADVYVVWAWAAAASTYPNQARTLDGAALKAHVAARIAGWSPGLRTLIDATDPATVAPVPLRTMPQLPAWTPSRVTLLGDAIHNMTPMAGIGANTALRDAGQLRQALAGGGDLIAAIGRYETAMRGYANEALALSTRNASSAALAGRTGRTAFRLLLRATARSPWLQHRMFGLTL
jgi:2-polyprenyl-6-methoxyphenol hydroxylase-like FAD-dependent oxidoreductase